MGERSQMYVKGESRFQRQDGSFYGNKGFMPLYFQWNIPENMVARARQLINLNDYQYAMSSSISEWEQKQKAVAEVNFCAFDNKELSHVLSLNLKKECKENIQYWADKNDLTAEEKYNVIYNDIFNNDNNHGHFYLDVKISKLITDNDTNIEMKYAFDNGYNGNENPGILSAAEFIKYSDYELDFPKNCNENIKYIEETATLMTEKELDQYKGECLIMFAEELKMSETEIKEMIEYLHSTDRIKGFEFEPDKVEPSHEDEER